MFNAALTECFTRITNQACDLKTLSEKMQAKSICESFYNDLLSLDKSTINQTKATLSESVTFIKDCISIAESIAEDKAEAAKEEELDITDDQEIELSKEDEEVIDTLFNSKNPELQVDVVRDATVRALIEEDKKAQEIKDALSIANSQVETNDDPKAVEETVNRLDKHGPTSLMHAIMNSYSAAAFKSVNENSKDPVSVKVTMKENADMIKARSTILFSLFETSSVFGMHKYSNVEVKKLAENFYYGK